MTQPMLTAVHTPDLTLALELRMQIRSAAWTLVHLLSLVVEEAFPITVVAPWRNKQPPTGGLVVQWLRMEFAGLAFRGGFNRKSSIFTFPEQRGDPRLRVPYRSSSNSATVRMTQG